MSIEKKCENWQWEVKVKIVVFHHPLKQRIEATRSNLQVESSSGAPDCLHYGAPEDTTGSLLKSKLSFVWKVMALACSVSVMQKEWGEYQLLKNWYGKIKWVELQAERKAWIK